MGERPTCATVFVSSRCVNNCIFCAPAAIRDEQSSIPDSEIRDFILRSASMGAQRIAFSGAGEPTLNPNLADYAEIARNAGYQTVTVFTNGYGLDRPLLNRLMDSGVDGFLVSVHGTREVHDRVVGRDGSFDEAITALKLVTVEDLTVTVNTCITRPAVGTLGELVALVRTHGPTRHLLAFPEWSGRALENLDLLVTYEEYEAAIRGLGQPPPPGIELENIPHCMAPPGYRLSRAEGSIVYRDPVFESVMSRDLNLGNNTYLPRCREESCVHLGMCTGVDQSYVARSGTEITVRPVSGPILTSGAEGAQGVGRATQRTKDPTEKWVYRVSADLEPSPGFGRVILRGEDATTLAEGHRIYSEAGVDVVGFELPRLAEDIDALARLPGRPRVDIRLTGGEIFDLYRIVPLMPELQVRVLLGASVDLGRDVHIAASQRQPVLVWDDPSAFSQSMLEELTEYYLHERLLKVPVEPFHTVLMNLLRRPGPTLWDLYKERPQVLVYVDDDARVTLSETWAAQGRYYGTLDQDPAEWRRSELFEWLLAYRRSLYETNAPCITCAGFRGCAGFLIRHDQTSDCSQWRTVFETIEAESREIREALAAVADGGSQ